MPAVARAQVVTAPPSIAELFTQHVRFVWRVLSAHGVRSADVEDMTQEVFIVANRRFEEGESPSAIKSWLYAIAIRVAANHRRRAHVRRERSDHGRPEPAVHSDPSEAIDQQRLLARLYDALDDLDEEKRDVLVAFELEGLPMKEVADAIGCPLSTAYTRLYAAREDLARLLRRAP